MNFDSIDGELPPDRDDTRPLQSLDDKVLMEWVVDGGEGNADCLHAREARRELWYRLKAVGRNWTYSRCGFNGPAVLELAWMFCVEDAPVVGEEENFQLKEFLFTRIYRAIGRERLRKGEEVMEAFDREDANEPQAEELLIRKEVRQAVREALAALPKKVRDCLLGRLVSGLTFAQLSERLQWSVGKVKQQLKWGLDTMRRRLESRDIMLPVGLVIAVIVESLPADAMDARLERLLDAGPALATGTPVPPEALTPVTHALYWQNATAVVAATSPWWAAGGFLAVIGPILLGLILWNWPEAREQRQLAAAVVTAPQPIIEPESSKEVEPTPVIPPVPVKPGGFPDNPEPGQVHTLVVSEPPVEIDFAWVPPNEYLLMRGFWMMRTEFPQGQFTLFKFPSGESQAENPSYFVGDDLPVENISADECQAFAEHFSQVTGVPVRLPTQQEWRQAAKGGSKELQPKPSVDELLDLAWFEANGDGRTHLVGLKRANGYNLFDLYGNVFEISRHSTTGDYRIHGGCWCYNENWCVPSSYSVWKPDLRQSGVGFRLVHVPADPD
ncbi:MAG TPA: SUMF1/EgtB/PvdO family nonheme iron enzyme [Planctomycetaceae bacterium]|nr:SUMF1/EgtB/PvdO family nonheme iron enzyme [Planctomycetaceae bacterium]